MPALFTTSMTEASRHKLAALRSCLGDFETPVFNQEEVKSREDFFFFFGGGGGGGGILFLF